jgi:hypothetical protein
MGYTGWLSEFLVIFKAFQVLRLHLSLNRYLCSCRNWNDTVTIQWW